MNNLSFTVIECCCEKIIYAECPVCGYLTIEGHGDICCICFWEYDGFVEYKGHLFSSMNGMTIEEARTNFYDIGACYEDFLKYVIPTEARKYYIHSDDK